MGSFYVNYTVRLPDQNAVAKALGGRTAYVSPAKNGAVVGGRCTDEYNSSPGYFEGRMDAPSGGDSRKLCAIFGRGGQEAGLEEVLRADSETYVFAYERHAEIVRLLGLPDYAVAGGFRYIEQGELPEGLTKGELLKTR